MSGEKMLKALNSADQDNNKKLDSKELHDAIKDLDKGQIQRGLKNKIDDIKKLKDNGLHEATRDLLTQVESNPNNLSLSEDQLNGLYALHVLLNPAADQKTQLDVKKLDKTLNKNEVMDDVYKANIGAFLKNSDYTFVDWFADGGVQQGVAVIKNTATNDRYHISFATDGTPKIAVGGTLLDTTYTVDGAKKTDAKPKMAYLDTGKKLIIEDKELFDKKVKTKEFANKLDALSVDGIFLKQQQSDGSMNVVYFSETGLSTIVKPIFEKGEGIDPTAKNMFDTYNTAITSAEKAKVDAISAFDAGKAKIDAMTSTTTEVWRKGEVTKLETIRDGELKKQQSIIDANNENLVDLYKTYASSNVESLIDKSTDKFTINTDLTLTNALGESVSLNVDGKKDPESVSGHVALDNNNLLLKIDKTATNTGWTAYKKKVGEDTGYTTQSTKGVDVTNPVVEKPKEVVSENVDLNKRIDALNDGFMFNGGNVDKISALKSTKDSLKLLTKKGKIDSVDWMVQNLEGSSLSTLSSTQRLLMTRNVQDSINQLITDNNLKFSINSPYFVNGKLKPDGRWGKISTEALVQVANNLAGTTVEANKGGTTVEANKGTIDNSSLIASIDTNYPTLSDLLSLPKNGEITKESIDNFPSAQWKATKLFWTDATNNNTAYVFENKADATKKFASLNTYDREYKSSNAILYMKNKTPSSMQSWNQYGDEYVQKFDMEGSGSIWTSFDNRTNTLSFQSNAINDVLKNDLKSSDTVDQIYANSLANIDKSLNSVV